MEKRYERGRQQDVNAYFWAHPDRVITVDELEKHFKGKYNRSALMAVMSHVCRESIQNRFPELKVFQKLGQGAWRLNTPKDVAGDEPETQKNFRDGHMLVEVLRERATHLIVEDTEDGKLYKMYLVG